MRSTLIALALVAASLSIASANDFTITRHGMACQPSRGSETRIGYTTWGVGNYSTSSEASVFCPSSETVSFRTYDTTNRSTFNHFGSLIDSIQVFALDNTASAPMFCQLLVTDLEGSTWWGPRRYTCSQEGGCPDETTSYRGFANLTLNSPFNTWYWGNLYGVYCSLPPAGAEQSWIKGMITSG